MRYRDYIADRWMQILLAGAFLAALLAFGFLAQIPGYYLAWVAAAFMGAGQALPEGYRSGHPRKRSPQSL